MNLSMANKKEIIKSMICSEIDKSFEIQPALDPKDIQDVKGTAFPPWLVVMHFLRIFNQGNVVVDITIPIKNDVCGRIKKEEITDSQWAPDMQDVMDLLRGGKNGE